MSNQLKEMATRPQAKTTSLSIRDHVNNMGSQFELALGGDKAKADRFRRIALTVINDPKIASCEPKSILGAMMQACQLGLDPNVMGQCYLIPYGNKCTFQLGYQGLKTLFYRSALALDTDWDVIYDNDVYTVKKGLNPEFDVFPAKNHEGAKPIAYYAVARLKTGGALFEIMYLSELNAHRDKYSKSSKYGSSPWVTNYPEMCQKTVFIKLMKRLPMELDISTAIAQDNTIKSITPEEKNIDMTEKMDETDYSVEEIKGEDLNEFELLDVAKQLLKDNVKLSETKKSKFKKDIDEYAINGSSKDAINKLIAEIKEA